MPRYAERTDVAPDRSKAEIERTLMRYGADQFAYGFSGDAGMIGFRYQRRLYRLTVPIPKRDSDEITQRGINQYSYEVRPKREQDRAYDQALRQRWRAVALIVKAKLEAVDAGIVSFEDEFLAWAMLPDGQTVRDWLQPQVDASYATGQMPDALPGLDVPRRALPAA